MATSTTSVESMFGMYKITWTVGECVVCSLGTGCVVDIYRNGAWLDTGRLPGHVRHAAMAARPPCTEAHDGHQCVYLADHRVKVADHPSGKAPGEPSDHFNPAVGWWTTAGPSKCYACDAAAVGLRDRRPEGLVMERACERHADPTVPVASDE